uniref:CSON006246 protein n=1 Tax=Culicoides sonorensis TaxID=179676 RepID=A0A336M005_CULSO
MSVKEITYFFFKVLTEVFYDFAENTKINGMHYLKRGVTTGILRILWAIWMITMLCFGAYIAILLWDSFVYSPTRVTSDSVFVKEVPFPAVTICHPQSIMDYQVERFLKEIQIPSNTTKEEVGKKLVVLSMFTEYQWDEPVEADLNLIHHVLTLNNYTVERAIDYLGTTCENFLQKCFWAQTEFPCFGTKNQTSKLQWKSSFSFLGSCCSINYYPDSREDLFKTESIGILGGLTILLTGAPQISDGKSGALYSDGFVLLAHHPNDFAVQSNYMTLLEQGTESFVEVFGSVLTCTNEVLSLPIPQRNCLLPSDLSKSYYRQPSCSLGCVRNKIYEFCGCHPYQMPRPFDEPNAEYVRDCITTDAMCIVKNMMTFKTLSCPECLPSCDDITYKTRSFKVDLALHNRSFQSKYDHITDPQQDILVNVYWANERVPVNRKIIVVNWVQNLANLGGCFNLVFGISVLSLIEILYALTVRFVFHFRAQKKLKKAPIINVEPKEKTKIKERYGNLLK